MIFDNGTVVKRRVRGYSIVELMIAMTIGLVLLGVITYSYVGTKTTFRAQDALSRKAENGRVALEMIARDIREAARFGCKRAGPEAHDSIIRVIADFPVMEETPAAFQAAGLFRPGVANRKRDFVRANFLGAIGELNPAMLVRSFESGAGFTPRSDATYTPIAGTDVLRLLKTAEGGSHLSTAMASDTGDILLADVISGAKPGSSEQLFLVSDCQAADLLRATVNSSGSAAGGKLAYAGRNVDSPSLATAYGTDAWVSPFDPVVYFVAQPSSSSQVSAPVLIRTGIATSNTATDIPGRWAKDGEIVADGIEDLQIRFGVDETSRGSPSVYYDGGAAGIDWSKVVTAEISLVVVSEADRVTASPSQKTRGGTDHRFRQRLTTVVQLRNRQT